MAASVDEFAIRLERLDEITQKGVHAQPTMADLDFGVIAGEVLALTQDGHTVERSSAAFPANEV